MNKPLIIGIAALFFSLHTSAAQPSDTEAENLGREIAAFYRHPSDTLAADLLHRTIRAGIRRNTALVWGTQVLQKNPKAGTLWCSHIRSYTDSEQTFAIRTLALTATLEARRCIDSLPINDEIKTKLKQQKASNPLQKPITKPADLDFHWANYFATGNPEAVERIAAYILNAEKSPETASKPTQAAAVWSTRSNMQQDAAIDTIVRRYIAKQTEQDRTILAKQLIETQAE